MKKLLFILLAAIFVAGCSDNGKESNSEASSNEGSTETQAEDTETEGENEKRMFIKLVKQQ